MKVKSEREVAQSCPTPSDPMECGLPGSSIHGIFQAKVLEWGAIAFSNALKWKGKVKSLSRVQLLRTPWTSAYQVPPSMGFSRQEYWSGVLLPSPWCTLHICKISRVTIYSPVVLLSQYWTSQLLHVQFKLLLLDSHMFTYIPSFLDFFPIYVTPEHWAEFPVL